MDGNTTKRTLVRKISASDGNYPEETPETQTKEDYQYIEYQNREIGQTEIDK